MEESPLRVLFVEGDAADREACSRMAEAGRPPFDCRFAGSLAEAGALLGACPPEVIVASPAFHGGTVPELLALAHAQGIPCIVLQNLDGEALGRHENAFACLAKDPARNYLNVLPCLLKSARRQKATETDLKETRTQLEQRVEERTWELARAVQALEASEARLKGIINSAMDGIVTINERQEVLFFNAAAEAMFRCPAAEAMGRHISRFIPARYHAAHVRHVETFARAGVTNRPMGKFGIVLGLRATGEEFPIEATISMVSAGGQKYFTVIMRDISERIKLEEQLRQSQKMEAIGRLSGGIAHDFNNLLVVLLGRSELIRRRKDLDEGLRKEVEEICQAGNRAANLTKQLLAFSRQQVLRPVSLNLNEVIANIQRMLVRLIGEDIVFQTDLDPGLERVMADPSQIEQILLNLAINARDAMPNGGKLVIATLRTEVHDDLVVQHPGLRPGPYCVLAVSDTGSGMDAATQARIFEPFFTTKEQGKGTGLGLATVYGIAQQSGGAVIVESIIGQGTVFRVFLPRAVKPAEERPGTGEYTPPKGQELILLVEDEEDVRKMNEEILVMHGYRVLSATDPLAALEIAAQEKKVIDLLVSDVVMPHMNGVELYHKLRVSRPGLKVLFVSGYFDHDLSESKMVRQDMPFLQKPYSINALARKVREALAGEATGRKT